MNNWNIWWGLHVTTHPPGTVAIEFNYEGMDESPLIVKQNEVRVMEGFVCVYPGGELGSIEVIRIPIHRIREIIQYGE